MKAIQLTIIVPVYKGEPFLEQLLKEVSTVVSQVAEAGTPLEISECICVDDGSIDKSAEVLVKLAGIYPWLRVLTLSMNFGQHPATVAGILNSSGDWLVTLDEDLQHRPNHMLAMLWQACIDGADVVYAKPLNGPHQSFFRDTASRVAKSCVARFTGNPFVKDFSSFRLIRGDVARAAAASCSRETYFDIALTWYTRRFTTLCIDMTDLRYTESNDTGYRPSQLLQHAVRLMVTSDARILRLGFRAGAFGMIMGLIITIAIVATKVWQPSGIPVQGWTSQIVALLLFGSLLSMQLGVAMKFLSLILQRSQGKPTFFVIDRSEDAALHLAVKKIMDYWRLCSTPEQPVSTEPILEC